MEQPGYFIPINFILFPRKEPSNYRSCFTLSPVSCSPNVTEILQGQVEREKKKEWPPRKFLFPTRIRIAYEFIMAIRGSLRRGGAKISTNVRIHDTESYKLADGCRYSWDFPTILSWSLGNFSLKRKILKSSIIPVIELDSLILNARIFWI